MHGGSRRSNFALVVVALTAMLLLVSCCGEPSAATEQHYASQADAEASVDPVSPAVRSSLHDEACAQAAESGSDDPEYHNKRDLCAQYRAAVAAEANAESACWQIWLSGLGLVALLISLWFTGWAAREAANSARAAAISNDQAGRFFAEERRPWVAVTPGLANVENPTLLGGYPLQMVAKNTGLTPAVNVNFQFVDPHMPDWGAVRMRSLKESVEQHRAIQFNSGIALFPGQDTLETVVIDLPEMAGRPAEITRFVGGFVRYEFKRDEKLEIHFTPFVFMLMLFFDGNGRYIRADCRPFIISIQPD